MRGILAGRTGLEPAQESETAETIGGRSSDGEPDRVELLGLPSTSKACAKAVCELRAAVDGLNDDDLREAERVLARHRVYSVAEVLKAELDRRENAAGAINVLPLKRGGST